MVLYAVAWDNIIAFFGADDVKPERRGGIGLYGINIINLLSLLLLYARRIKHPSIQSYPFNLSPLLSESKHVCTAPEVCKKCLDQFESNDIFFH